MSKNLIEIIDHEVKKMDTNYWVDAGHYLNYKFSFMNQAHGKEI